MLTFDDDLFDTEPMMTNGRRVCPQCGTPFSCGIASGDDSCWCFAVPHIIALDSGEGSSGTAQACLCPNCLHLELSRKMQYD